MYLFKFNLFNFYVKIYQFKFSKFMSNRLVILESIKLSQISYSFVFTEYTRQLRPCIGWFFGSQK